MAATKRRKEDELGSNQPDSRATLKKLPDTPEADSVNDDDEHVA